MRTISNQHMLSKSTFIRGCKCLKSLHLYKHRYDLRDETSASQQAIFDQGHEVGAYAQQLFPGGVDCTVEPAYDYAASAAKTQAALDDGARVLYEAGFVYNNVYAAVDILVVEKSGWYVYEVKSSTEVKDYHYLDAAIQYYILKGLGLPVKAVHVVTINNQYVRKGDVDPRQLFTITNVTKEAVAQQLFISEQLPVFFNTLKSRTTPNIQIGPQCDQYYGCDFHGHCWKMFDNVDHPVTEISRIGKKLWDLVEKGILCQTQVPATYPLSEHQRIQVHGNQTQTSPEPDHAALQVFIGQVQYPIAFLDFETFNTAIPLFDDVRPYQQVPFQYSVHVLQEDGTYMHHEFLSEAGSDPRRLLLESLLPLLENAGTIMCYNVSFERARLEDLMNLFPEHGLALQAIIGKLVDLITPFRSKHVYHYKMNGSASIKSVLPALLPHLSYDDLEISEGGMASQAFLNLFAESDAGVVAKTRETLLEYCKLDTWGMVELWGYLNSVNTLRICK